MQSCKRLLVESKGHGLKALLANITKWNTLEAYFKREVLQIWAMLKLGWYRGLFSSLHFVAEGFFCTFVTKQNKKGEDRKSVV